jgi:hypothetical protein
MGENDAAGVAWREGLDLARYWLKKNPEPSDMLKEAIIRLYTNNGYYEYRQARHAEAEGFWREGFGSYLRRVCSFYLLLPIPSPPNFYLDK